MRIATLLYLIVIFLESCTSKPEQDAIKQLVSNFETTNSVHLQSPMPAKNYIVGYGRNGFGITTEFRDSVDFWDRKVPKLSERTKKFNVWIDTSNSVSIEFPLDELGYPEADSINFSIDSSYEKYGVRWADFPGFHVYIMNEDTSEHVLELQDGAVYMIYEAQDSTGNWRPIENWFFTHFCGNSYYELVFRSKSYIVSKVIKYDGDFETNIRLKFRNFDFVTYSNTFRGTINYEQLNDSNFVAYSNKMAELYCRNPDSLKSYANNYLAAMRLEKSL